MRWPAAMLIFAAALTSGGCVFPAVGFDSPDPAARLPAIAAAARDGDTSHIPDLIASLDSDDPVVRLAAIQALEALTARTLGYNYADPRWKRQDAVDRWMEWYAAQPSNGPPARRGPGEPASGDAIVPAARAPLGEP